MRDRWLIVTEGSTATETATVTASLTPSETGTLPPSETPVPTESTATDTYEFIPPTRAPTRTTEPPIQYPTDTPVPPTQAPAPTNTAVPPNTPTFIPLCRQQPFHLYQRRLIHLRHHLRKTIQYTIPVYFYSEIQ